MTGRKFRVLLAESTPGGAAECLRALYPEPEHQLELSVVCTMQTLLATIELAMPETILLDLSLGRPDPLDAVRRVHRAAPGIPLIVLAESADQTYAARSISEGAMDYLLKEFIDTRNLERVIRAALERNTLQGLADLLRDPQTGLYNRDGLMTLGVPSLETAKRTGSTVVLLCVSLENYSALQEEYGSRGGDQAIRETAELLTTCFRRSDYLARLGKEQFAALALDAAEPSARILCQRVESRLSIHNEGRRPWKPLALRFSVGYRGEGDTRSFPEFLKVVESELCKPGEVVSQFVAFPKISAEQV
ncbi:MAG TPA: diguanylate cyclase [Candidatus Acidoferrum sp.]|nr:diguanylate cyclase [Candidatus Acidoferrum sp.]